MTLKTSKKLLKALLLPLLIFQTNSQIHDNTQCTLPSEIFNVQLSKPEYQQISQQTMCPSLTSSCCTSDNYRAMNLWWQDDGPLSMVTSWNEKINSIFSTLTYREQTILRLVEYAKSLKDSSSSNV